MSRFRIGILLDNPKRDLTGTLLLAKNLADDGNLVSIIPAYNQYFEVPLIKLDAIVVGYARLTNKEQMQAYREMGLTVYVLDTEGGLVSTSGPRTPENWAKFTKESGLYQHCDHYLFWGSALYEAFSKWSGLRPNQLHLTGCPRYDVVTGQWKSLLNESPEKFVLINTSFPPINPKYTGSSAKELNSFLEAGLDREFSSRLFDELRRIFEEFSIVARRLVEACPDISFVLRPHPFENVAYYEQLLAGLGNVRVECKNEIFDVLSNCSSIVHINCGTAVDARLMGRQPFSLEWINSDFARSFSPLPGKVSHAVRSFEELVIKVRETHITRLCEPLSEELMNAAVTPSFGFHDGMSALRVAKTIISTVTTTTRTRTTHWKFFWRSCRKTPRLRHRLMAFTYFLFGTRPFDLIRNRFSEKRDSKFVSLKTYRAKLREIDKVSNTSHSTTVRFATHWGPWRQLSSVEVISAKNSTKRSVCEKL